MGKMKYKKKDLPLLPMRFRIVYRISSEKLIEIIAIGPRERIYEKTFLILKKERAK